MNNANVKIESVSENDFKLFILRFFKNLGYKYRMSTRNKIKKYASLGLAQLFTKK